MTGGDVKNLANLVDEHFRGDIENKVVAIEYIRPSEFLKSNRLDLVFKIMFLQMYEYKIEHFVNLYIDHIKAFSFGKFTEPGNTEKVGCKKFIDDFVSIYESIKKSGFNPTNNLVCSNKYQISFHIVKVTYVIQSN